MAAPLEVLRLGHLGWRMILSTALFITILPFWVATINVPIQAGITFL
jgi:hypothetical protein